MASQLRKCIMEVGVSQDELRQILNQLRELVKTTSNPSHTQQSPPPNNWSAPSYPSRTAPPPPPPSAAYPSNPFPASYSNLPSHVPQQASLPASVAFPDTDKLNSIINSLVSAGVVPAAGTATSPVTSTSKATTAPSNGADHDAWREYRAALLSQKSKLSSLDILRYVLGPRPRRPCVM